MTSATSADAWRVLAEKALGSGLEAACAKTLEGVSIRPLYDRETRDLRRPWRGGAAWAVAQRMDHPDVAQANQAALRDLEGGADALTLVFAGSPFARGFGLPLDAAALDRALADIELDFIGLRLDAGSDTAEATTLLAGLIEARRLTSAGLRIDLGFDPIGFEARGQDCGDGDLAQILDTSTKSGLLGCPFLADGRPYHEAGAGEARELAAILGTGVAYLRLLESHGLSLDEARRAIAFQLAVDADVFLGLAKTRALRRLWARVEQASGLTPEPIRLHAETAWRMMARRDPWVNVMRTTAATVAAGLGGADVVTVLPFTLPLGLPDEAARRLARNVQRVLLDEANLGRVDDPAAGAGGFEALTDALCAEAWGLFQAIEGEGGMAASLRNGTVKARITETARARAAGFATLREGIIGTNRFPSLDAPPVVVLDVAPHAVPMRDGALPSLRDATPFEALRDAAEALPRTPTVFLATLGAPSSYGARATYAANVFAAAGIEARPALAARDISTLAADFRASNTPVACVCGSDKAYAESAAALIEALRDAGARRILLAGRFDPAGGLADLVDASLHDGCPAIDVLAQTLNVLSMP